MSVFGGFGATGVRDLLDEEEEEEQQRVETDYSGNVSQEGRSPTNRPNVPADVDRRATIAAALKKRSRQEGRLETNRPNYDGSDPEEAAWARTSRPGNWSDYEYTGQELGGDSSSSSTDTDPDDGRRGAGNEGSTTNVTIEMPDEWDREQTDATSPWDELGISREMFLMMAMQQDPYDGPPMDGGGMGPTPMPPPPPDPDSGGDGGGISGGTVVAVGAGAVGLLGLAYIAGWI